MLETLELKNAAYNADGNIDVEINHPDLGWIPFTAIDNPGDESSKIVWDRIQNGESGEVSEYIKPESKPLTQADYSNAIQAHLDAKARERQYDNLLTAITYRDDPNSQFAKEGQTLFKWRSDVWSYATAELAKVNAGERAQPTVDTLIAELPTFTWPNNKT